MKNKKVLLTGCTSGIGKAVLDRLLALGADVLATSRRATSLLQTGDYPEAVRFIDCDVRSETDVQTLFSAIRGDWGGLDVLINNAATIHVDPIVACSFAQWQDVIHTNLCGPLLTMKYALPIMAAQKSGIIVNTVSMEGVNCTPGFSSYSASKAALIALTKSAAREMVHYSDIAIVALIPGDIRTSMNPGGTENPEAAAQRLIDLLNVVQPEDSGKIFLAGRFVEATLA